MKPMTHSHWTADDELLEAEFEDVIDVVRESSKSPVVPSALNRKIAEMAGADPLAELSSSWLLGQGPRVILVTLIFFAIAVGFFFLT